MKLDEFVSIMEKIAPPSLAADFDNPGLLIDNDGKEIRRVLVALDCTPPVAQEAVEGGFDLVLTHHPLIFHPIRHITGKSFVTSAAKTLIANNIAFYCAHTNLDKAIGGVNDVLASLFDLRGVVTAEPENYARVGDLPEILSLTDFAALTDRLLGTKCRCAVGDFRNDPENVMIRRVAVLGGSGGDDIELVREYGADVFVTGEIKHSKAIESQFMGLSVLEAGHYETERVVLPALISYLQNAGFDVEYKMSECEGSPLRSL